MNYRTVKWASCALITWGACFLVADTPFEIAFLAILIFRLFYYID